MLDPISHSLLGWLLASWLRSLPLLGAVWVIDLLLARWKRHEIRPVGWWLVLIQALIPIQIPGLALDLPTEAPPAVQTASGALLQGLSFLASGAAVTWVVGALLLLTREMVTRAQLCRSWESMRRFDQEAGPVAVASALAGELGLRVRVRVVVSAGVNSPAVAGPFHPTIYLPCAWVANAAAKDLRQVLLHELLHVRRGDLFGAGLLVLLASVAWPQFAVGIAVRRLLALQEFSVDREAIERCGADLRSYRLALLRAATQPSRTPGSVRGAGTVGLVERLGALSGADRRRWGAATRSLIAGSYLLLAVGITHLRWAEAAPIWDASTPGCLRLRYHVLGRMADGDLAPPPTPSESLQLPALRKEPSER